MSLGKTAVALLAGLAAMGGPAAAQQAVAPDGAVQAVAPPLPALAANAAAPAPVAGPAATAVATAAPARSPSRMHRYLHDLLGPGSLLGVGAGAAVEQLSDSPAQWGTGASGFGKRVASSAGDLFVQETVRHGLAAAMDRSTDYERCGCSGAGPRIEHAFTETFTDRDTEGRRQFSVPRVAGAVAGGFAPMLWWPGATVASAVTATGVSLLFTVAGNAVKEFVHGGGVLQP